MLVAGASGKALSCQYRIHKRSGFNPWVRKIPWRKAWQHTAVLLPGGSPCTKEPGRLESIGSQRVRHNWSNLARTHAQIMLSGFNQSVWKTSGFKRFLQVFPGGPVVGSHLSMPVSLVQEDATYLGTPKSTCHNYWGCTPESVRCSCWSRQALEPFLCKERSHHSKKPAHHQKEYPHPW